MIKQLTFKSISLLVLFALLLTLLFPASVFAGKKDKTEITYDSLLFDQSYVHTIDIQMSEEDLSDMLAHASSKTKYKVNVIIDDEEFDDVSISTKGNTSLASIAMSDSNRYSFKINFGKYIDGQTYHGLKKLNLSNLFSDATYMKDYLSYEIFRELGVNSALTSYILVSINGETHGLYLAVENIDGNYLDRTTNGEGELYKPSNGLDNMGGGDREEGESDGDSADGESNWEAAENADSNSDEVTAETAEAAEIAETTEAAEIADTTEAAEAADENAETVAADSDSNTVTASPKVPETAEAGENAETVAAENTDPAANGDSNGDSRPGESAEGDSEGGFDGAGMNAGADLAYIDDDIESYSAIFDNAETKVTNKDEKRVVKALKNLSEGKVEDALDTDEVIRYFAAHNFVMNYDSYTGGMLHNYYLYENDGKLSMLPWDYNLGFGSFSNMDNGDGATVTVNYGIDSPLSGASESSRPMWAWIVENEDYLAQYHEVYNELLTNYFESGKFEAEVHRVYEMIRPYVEEDPSAFYTVEQFDKAYESIVDFCLLRAESIRKQLNGELSTITNDQTEEDRVDASEITISDTGKFSMGGDHDGDSEGDSNGDSASNSGESNETAADANEIAAPENPEITTAPAEVPSETEVAAPIETAADTPVEAETNN